MISEELIDTLRSLDHKDKLRAMQILLQEIAQEEDPLLPEVECPVWSPYEAYEAAQTLRDYMEAGITY